MSNFYSGKLKKAQEYVAVSAWKQDYLVTKAEGCKIWLNDKPCLDFACGPGVANVGWNHPEVHEVIKRVLDAKASGYGGNMILNSYQIDLAENLAAITPGKFSKRVFFSNSGAEAVEAAMLACLKKRPARRGFTAFIRDFHGRTGYSRAATTSREMHFERLPQGLGKFYPLVFPAHNPETAAGNRFMAMCPRPEDYLVYVENAIGPFINEINFAVLELVQGEGGINIAQWQTLKLLVDYLKKHKVFVIIDEVQSGLGRTGKMWACDHCEIEPDIITTAKALSGGLIPIGATIMREDLSYQQIGEHCNTFGGSALACAVGLKVLEILQKYHLLEQAEIRGHRLRSRLMEANNGDDQIKAVVSNVSGCGLMNRITFVNPDVRDRVATEAIRRGLYLTAAGEQSLRLMPPLTIAEDELEQALKIIIESIRQVHSRL